MNDSARGILALVILLWTCVCFLDYFTITTFGNSLMYDLEVSGHLCDNGGTDSLGGRLCFLFGAK